MKQPQQLMLSKKKQKQRARPVSCSGGWLQIPLQLQLSSKKLQSASLRTPPSVAGTGLRLRD